MANKTLLLLCLATVSVQAWADGTPDTAAKGACGGHIASPAHCHWIDGTMSIYNGTPSVRIHQQGGKQVYGVGPSEDEWMPDSLKGQLTPETTVTGKFKLCPIPGTPPRGLPMVCVDDVKIKRTTTP